MVNPLDLSGKTVLVTGASSGIGRATAALLGQLGARVVLSGRDEVRLEAALSALPAGAGHLVAPFDLSAVEAIPGWLQQVSVQVGPLHGLVHCAGVMATVPIRFMAAQAAESMMRANWLTAWELAKGFRQKKVVAGGQGRIVFVSSVHAVAGQPGVTAYASSKGALLALTRALALEFAPERITVNAVLPGLVRTEMMAAMEKDLTEEQMRTLCAKYPLGVGEPQDVAQAIAFLVSEASRWITGTVLTVDGGYTAQ